MGHEGESKLNKPTLFSAEREKMTKEVLHRIPTYTQPPTIDNDSLASQFERTDNRTVAKIHAIDWLYFQRKTKKMITAPFCGNLLRQYDYRLIWVGMPKEKELHCNVHLDLLRVVSSMPTMNDEGLYHHVRYDGGKPFFDADYRIGCPEYGYDFVYEVRKPEKRITSEFVRYLIKPWGLGVSQ